MNLKIIYMPILHNDQFIMYCAIASIAVSILGAIFWGYLADSKGFYFTLLFFVSLDFVVKLYGSFATSQLSVLIFFIAIGIVDKAMVTIMGPGLVRIFGIKIGT